MYGSPDSRHPVVGLVDEIGRLHGRLKSLFAASRHAIGLNDSEIMVLNAVVESRNAPTVAQIGRSLGHPRQLIQRAANSLKSAGFIESIPNPDHKRAPLLRATVEGLALKREADRVADEIAAGIDAPLDMQRIAETAAALQAIRRQFERNLRGKDDT